MFFHSAGYTTASTFVSLLPSTILRSSLIKKISEHTRGAYKYLNKIVGAFLLLIFIVIFVSIFVLDNGNYKSFSMADLNGIMAILPKGHKLVFSIV